MDWGRFRLSLALLQVVAACALLRSIAYDRWITVAVAGALLVGASVARRGKTWGTALIVAASVWFPMAWALGMAPGWFALVGLLGIRPLAQVLRPMLQFDRAATGIVLGAAGAIGAAGAFAWREVAWSLFQSIPALRPSLHAHHGALLMAAAAASIVAVRLSRSPDEAKAKLRIAGGGAPREREDEASEAVHVRVAEHELDAMLDDDRAPHVASAARRHIDDPT